MSARTSSYQPRVELLEARELLAGSIQAYVTNGNLYINGTAGKDTIKVLQSNQQISVVGAPIAVNNSHPTSVDASTFSKVVIFGNGGNDQIDLTSLKKDAVVYAGTGNDTIRCGMSNVVVNNSGGFDWIYRPENFATPVAHGLDVSDIRQGQAPVCQTAAALAEALKQGHNFANDIRYLGNYTYQVKLYGDLGSQKVYFNGWTNSSDLVLASDGDFWAVLMERARLQALGIDPNRVHTLSEWNDLNKKTNNRLYSIGAAIYDFTGNSTIFTYARSLTPQIIRDALATGACVLAAGRDAGGYVSPDGIIGNHAYAVLGVFQEDGIWKVRLYNPWAMDSNNSRTIDALDRGKSPRNDGFITLSWQQFVNPANFQGFYIARAAASSVKK